ncbi:MAG: hypothetical protein IKV03_00310 [Alphaproteobacteria bacterium]|nr:hypothetical protein [Alphaproteobacteria bacterium]
MALKDILLAASIGATMATGTNTEAKETSVSDNTSSHTQTMSEEEIQEMNFQKNYRHLYKTVSGAWFSFGDEKKIRQALHDIASFSMGHEVIAGLPEDMSLSSKNFMPSNVYGALHIGDNSIILNTSYVDDTFIDKSIGIASSLPMTMFHELLHARQRKDGITLMDQQPSIDELLHAQKLIEAEAAAWTRVLAITDNFSSTGSFYLTPYEIKDLMQRDLISEERNRWKKNGEEHKFDKRREEIFKKINPAYTLQEALISCHGNYHLAQKKLVREEIKKLMSQNGHWAQFYNKQILGVASFLCSEGKVSKQGNPVAYQKMLDYYQKNYGLNPNEINNNNLKDRYADKIEELKFKAQKSNWYSDAKHTPLPRTIRANNGGR